MQRAILGLATLDARHSPVLTASAFARRSQCC